MTDALLSFSIGPVQDFIAAARTTRDLWTGSYLLSWLTAHAMAATVDQGGEIISPDVTANPLIEEARGTIPDGNGVLSPCLPQVFLARVTGDPASARQRCNAAVRAEWDRIARAVRSALHKQWNEHWPGWDDRWAEQIEHFWDIRVFVLPAGVPSVAEMQRLLAISEPDEFKLRREFLGRLAAAEKNIRHYPTHEFDENGRPDTRPKCSLLGSFAQMGPMLTCDEFWKGPRDGNQQRDWTRSAAAQVQIGGVRIGRRDRLCAVSLVKRFAWPCYFEEQFGVRGQEHEFPDIDTICAGKWLAEAKERGLFDRGQAKTDQGRTYWSGHWLRWKDRLEGRRRDADDPEECPSQETFDAILAAKRTLGGPPSYFGVLMVDGDRMGELIRHANESEMKNISRTLARFARQGVQPLVEDTHHGKLVYAGGDDVLALLPPTTALACARELAERFAEAMRTNGIQHTDGRPVTCSGGLAIAHAKANLRDVLQAARAAEHQAKQENKDRLTIAVLKRSGEHTSVSCSWPQVEQLAQLAADFASDEQRRGESDRWAYHFRRELESALPEEPDLLDAELRRLLGRAEGASAEFKERVQDFWGALDGKQSVAQAKHFTQLVQSASFLARGGKEER